MHYFKGAREHRPLSGRGGGGSHTVCNERSIIQILISQSTRFIRSKFGLLWNQIRWCNSDVVYLVFQICRANLKETSQ